MPVSHWGIQAPIDPPEDYYDNIVECPRCGHDYDSDECDPERGIICPACGLLANWGQCPVCSRWCPPGDVRDGQCRACDKADAEDIICAALKQGGATPESTALYDRDPALFTAAWVAELRREAKRRRTRRGKRI